MKKSLAYSALTDTVYYIDSKGKKVELPKSNFFQMILLWIKEGALIKVGEKVERTLSVKGKAHWSITIERLSN